MADTPISSLTVFVGSLPAGTYVEIATPDVSSSTGFSSYRATAPQFLAIGSVTSVGLALPVSVFSVSGSPVTTTGTLTGAFVSQTENTVFAGPATAPAAAPTFRVLAIADLPVNIPNSKLQNSSITLNAGSGVGLTAPGALSLGATGVIGATTDTVRLASLGLGVAAPASGLLNVLTGIQVNSAAASGNYLRGNGTNFVSSTIQSGDLPGSFTGFANPTATISTSGVNGSATTAMRSDAAPALASTIAAGGPIGSATVAPIITYNAAGQLTTVSSATITPAVGSITGLGTGVATALGVNVGSAGAFVTFNGAGGTPSSMTATNLTGTATSLTVGTANNVTGTGVGSLASLALGGATIGTDKLAITGTMSVSSAINVGTGGAQIAPASSTGIQFSTSVANAVAVFRPSTVNLLSLASTTPLVWSNDANPIDAFDLALFRDAANTHAWRNGANAQFGRIYGSWTDASNGDWLEMSKAAGGAAYVRTVANGTGTASTLSLGVGGTNYWTVGTGGSFTGTAPTGGIGYATGAGGAVTQGTNRTTGVTLNTVTGAITLISAAGSATPASFVVTNSAVAATDVVQVSQKSGTDLYEIFVTNVAAGSFKITSFTTGGTTTEQPVFNFVIIKGAAS